MSDGGGVVVTRWRRFGHDRLYVRAPDGTDLGWWDLDAAQVHARTPEREATVSAAATAWQAECGEDEVGGPAPEAEPAGLVHDLAELRPGAAARARAEAARDAAPVKTFFARLLGVHTEERAWRIGADGEEAVAATPVIVTVNARAVTVKSPATPVIVTVNARAVTVKSPPDGVHVVQRMHFARWLLRREDVHPAAAVDAVYEAARRSTTWQP